VTRHRSPPGTVGPPHAAKDPDGAVPTAEPASRPVRRKLQRRGARARSGGATDPQAICDHRPWVPMAGPRRATRHEEVRVSELVVKVVVNAAALYVAVQLIPDDLLSFDFGADWWKLLAVALIFALVNSYLRPIVKLLSLPISLMTLGLIAFVINAAMLLVVAFLSEQLDLGFRVGDFPPSFTVDTIVGALVGALVISVVSTLATVALAPRRLL
jgi:putative membrane protein